MNFKNYLQETKVTLQPFKPELITVRLKNILSKISKEDAERAIKWYEKYKNKGGGVDPEDRKGKEYKWLEDFIIKNDLGGQWSIVFDKLRLSQLNGKTFKVIDYNDYFYTIYEPEELKNLFVNKKWVELV